MCRMQAQGLPAAQCAISSRLPSRYTFLYDSIACAGGANVWTLSAVNCALGHAPLQGSHRHQGVRQRSLVCLQLVVSGEHLKVWMSTEHIFPWLCPQCMCAAQLRWFLSATVRLCCMQQVLQAFLDQGWCHKHSL